MSSKKNAAGEDAPVSRSPQTWVICLGLFVVTLAAYWNSFCAPFVFDDLQTIQRNASVHFGNLSLGIFPRALLFETFALNSIWSGQQVWSYHIVNFALHFFNGLFVFFIANRVLTRIPSPSGTRSASPIGRSLDGSQGEGLNSSATPYVYAALAAAFFLLHPVQTESVTYISSRSELLSTFFYLAGLLIFVVWPVDRIGLTCSFAVALAYFLGIGSKETAITLPATIFLYDFLFLSKAELRPVLSRWRFYLLYLLGASAAIYYLLTIWLKNIVGSNVSGNLSSWSYLLTETRVLVRYVQMIFFPVGLNLDHDFRPSSSLLDPAVLFSLAFLSGLVLLGWQMRRRAPVFAFSIFWFLITLSPTSSVIPIADVIFDHRLYLPMAGVVVSFPLLIEFLYRKLIGRSAEVTTPAPSLRLRPAGLALGGATPLPVVLCASIILGVLLVGTVMRNYVWGDEVRLFADVLAKSPLKDRPYNGLAFAYYKRGQYDRAAAVLEKASEILPNKAIDSWDTLANVYLKQGKYEKAISLFEKETQAFTGDRLALSYNNLGVGYLWIWTDLQNRRDRLSPAEFDSKKEEVLRPAAEAFSKAVEIAPDMSSSLDSYINVMCERGKGNELETLATEQLNGRQDNEPTHLTPQERMKLFSVLYTIGRVALYRQDYSKADIYFEQAEKVENDVKIAYFNHGLALTALKQDDRAIEKYTEAIRLEPIFAEAQLNLGVIYLNHRDYDKAIESFSEVLRFEPGYIKAHLHLASIYAAQGKRNLACEQLSTALALSPGDQQAAPMFQQLGCDS